MISIKNDLGGGEFNQRNKRMSNFNLYYLLLLFSATAFEASVKTAPIIIAAVET